MEMHGRDRVLSLLCRLVLQPLPKIFRLSASLPKEASQSDEKISPAPDVAVGCEREPPELPQDILLDIFARLEVPDLVRAGSVCSPWRAAYNSLCSSGSCSRLHQTPCLLHTSKSFSASTAGLYSLAEKKAYMLTLPDPPIRSRHIIGSSYGWIITVDEMCLIHLLNPITGEQIELPPVTTIEQVKPVFDDEGAICNYEYSWYTAKFVIADTPSIWGPGDLRDHVFYKAFLSSDPSAGDYFVVLIHNPMSQLSFARAGDDKWTWLPPHCDYEDCLFQGGSLLASTSGGAIHAFDLGNPTVEPKILLGTMTTKIMLGNMAEKIPDMIYVIGRIYIMEAPSGELLQVWRSSFLRRGDQQEDQHDPDEYDSEEYDPDEYDSEEYDSDGYDSSSNVGSDIWSKSNTNTIRVYKVDLTSKRLVEVSGFDDHVLFFGLNQSQCHLAQDYPQLKANHAYFTDDDYLQIKFFKNYRRDVGVFDMGNNSKEEIVSPQLWSNSHTPVWLNPSPRRMSFASNI